MGFPAKIRSNTSARSCDCNGVGGVPETIVGKSQTFLNLLDYPTPLIIATDYRHPQQITSYGE
jgi:hypothetical protein